MVEEARWNQTWERVTGTRPDPAVWQELLSHYQEPVRAYHNLDHILDCLQKFDLIHDQFQFPAECELALWAHDVIYDPQARDNEEQSAAWLRGKLPAASLAPEVLTRITGLILDTRHQDPPGTMDGALIVDIDLSILGSRPDQFDRYDQAIRREYSWVNDQQYRDGRLTVLQHFFRRPTLFHTPWFRDRYELSARLNLQTAIERLTRTGS